MKQQQFYTINDITRMTGSSCVVIYSRLRRLGLFGKKTNNKYFFNEKQTEKIVASLKEDRRYDRRTPFTEDDKKIIEVGLAAGLTEVQIARQVHCNDSTISKYKKRKLRGQIA